MSPPEPSSLDLQARVREFPARHAELSAPVDIYWNAHAVPYVKASRDEDLLFALGALHAHLRLSQMEIMRKISQGRLSEMAGPFTTDIDHSLRILNLGKAADNILAQMPKETRVLLDCFVAGINSYVSQLRELPGDMRLLGLSREPWTARDIIVMSRLFSVEVNWLVLARLLPLASNPAFGDILGRALASGRESPASFSPDEFFAGLSKSGSNSMVVSGARSASGAALIASDPHVGYSLPNLWLLVAFDSPSLHAVGYTFPGFPFVLLGRNRSIAWGGTNGWLLTSSLYRVEDEPLTQRTETIHRRWWWSREVPVRESRLGPIISDAPYAKGSPAPVALRWVGHEASDEMTAFLRVNRARNWQDFREAFSSYAVSAQNFLYADVEGNIGQLIAARVPRGATAKPDELIHEVRDEAAQWRGYLSSMELPSAYNPARGVLVSANNKAAETEPPLALFYAPSDRFERLSALLSGRAVLHKEDLMRMQQDVFSAGSLRVARAFVSRLEGGAHTGREQALYAALAAWDGEYRIDSRGAYAFELLQSKFLDSYYGARYGAEAAKAARGNLLAGFIGKDLDDPSQALDFKAHLERALADVAAEYDPAKRWGDVHFLELRHVLSRAPLLGRKYVYARRPIAGSSSTVNKSAHVDGATVHAATYGAVARHVSDLSDEDENYFVMLGGEDGNLASAETISVCRFGRRRRGRRLRFCCGSSREGDSPWRLSLIAIGISDAGPRPQCCEEIGTRAGGYITRRPFLPILFLLM